MCASTRSATKGTTPGCPSPHRVASCHAFSRCSTATSGSPCVMADSPSAAAWYTSRLSVPDAPVRRSDRSMCSSQSPRWPRAASIRAMATRLYPIMLSCCISSAHWSASASSAYADDHWPVRNPTSPRIVRPKASAADAPRWRSNSMMEVISSLGRLEVLEPPVHLGQDGQRMLLGYRVDVRPQ